MACYHPLLAWRCSDGEITFVERKRYDIVEQLDLPCGQCIGCRLDKSQQWAMRCMHESKLYKKNAFITLTYSPENLPANGQLVYTDFQAFMKRLRRHAPDRVRFYMCGEYGPELKRPHFHACLFNCDFDDKIHWMTGESGARIYQSKTLESLWGKGFCTVGDVTYETAAYTARYCMKKITGHNAKYYYGELTPEFSHMSLKPGIGARFLSKWESDIYPNDYVIQNGRKMKVPRYYDKIYKRTNLERYEQIQYERIMEARKNYEENTERRLTDKETVTKAKIAQLKRKL